MKAILVLWAFLIVLCDKQMRSSASTVNYVHIGCFKDTENRAMPQLLGNWRSKSSQAIQECARATTHAGYSAFGVQYGGECWSGPRAHLTFSMYGASRKCVNRLGRNWAQDVYMFLNASNIANYDIKRCYEVDISIYYRIPEGLTLSHNNISTMLVPFLSIVSSLLPRLPQCSGVNITMGVLQTSPPGQRIVFVKQTVIFTASENVPDDSVQSKLTTCIRFGNNYGKSILDRNIPSLSQNGVTYQSYNKSTISDKRSCCGGDIPPPCCAVGSVKVSSTKCGCLPGYRFVPGSLCVRCPKDMYQNKQGKTSCKRCPADKKTFGKTGALSASNCTANNPLQILEMKTTYLSRNIRSRTAIMNVTVTGKLASLVQPFLYYIDKLTLLQQLSNGGPRRRREAGDVCEEAGTIPPLNYFCIYRQSGQIIVTKHFMFKDGDEFELIIRVTDSDRLGKTENTAKVKFISRDDCRDILTAYEEAVKFCAVDESLFPGRCPSVKCLQPLYNWQKALSQLTDVLRVDCSSGPRNLTGLMQKYYNCIGPPEVTLYPVLLKVRLGTPAVLTCNATSPLNLTIAWFNDGAPLQRFQVGNQLRIPTVDYSDQGDYSCNASTVLTSSFSKHALLLLDGVLTSIVSFKILNKKYDADLFDDLKIVIERNVENYLNSEGSPWNYIVKLSNFRDLSGKVGVDLVLYSDVKTKDIVEYYAGLDKLLHDGDINKIFSSLRISQKSITIRSATYCLPKETGKPSVKGVFEWKLTAIGQNSSLISCPYGPPSAQAIRFCGGSFKTGGVWTHPDISSCKYKSERTNKLNNINKTAIDKMNVVQVTKEVKRLTSSPDEMNEADAILIADVIDDIVSLEGSLNETGQDVLDVIDSVMNMKKGDLQESQRSNKASSKFVRALDKVAESLPLSDRQLSRRLVAPSVAVQTNRVNPVSFKRLSLSVQTAIADPNKLTADSMVNEELLPSEVQTSITLPEALFQDKTPSSDAVKVGFVIYQNDIFFQPAVGDQEESIPGSVISRVVSSSVQDLTFQNLTQPVELVFQPAVSLEEINGNAVCVFWDFDALDGFGNWSSRGCKRVNSEAGHVKCHCDHMTNFAVLFSASGPTKHVGKHAEALSIISYVGCAISLVGLTITLLTYALFRNLRKTNQQPILMSLCVSLMLLLIVFIAGAEQTENLVGCRIFAVLIHYFALSSVLWMGVEGYNMYMSFVQVMATYQSKFILKASAVAWGLAAIIVIITVSAATSYYGNDDFCVLHGVPFQGAMFAPVLLIIVINFVIFFLALRSLGRTGASVSAEKKSTSYQRARTSVAILILLGLTWVFGALAVSRAQLAFDYLFCIFNSLQGFIIFYLHCIRHQEVRSQWKWFLLGKGRRYHPSSSESHTGYPKTNSKANKNDISNSSPMRKSFGMPRNKTTSTNDGESFLKPPTLDNVPAEV